MRALLILFISFLYLFGYEYNRFLLNTQADIYPKILLFDMNLPKKVADKKINFYIIYEDIDKLVAQEIQKRIKTKYKKIGGYLLDVKMVNFLKALSDNKIDLVDAIYVLKSERGLMRRLAKKIKGKYIYSFVYDVTDLPLGYLIGLDIEKEVTIYINKKVLLEEHFKFVEEFFLMARFVE